MTKKNVAALMLAGAMMTVGSGAMAAEVTESGVVKDTDVAKVAVSYTASADIRITLEWNEVGGFVYEWKPDTKKWTTETANQTLTFKAKNDGIVAQNVSISDTTGAATPAWLTVAEGAKTAANVEPAANASTPATEVAAFTLTGKDVDGIDGMKVSGDTENLSFTVTIADATAPQA